MEVPVLGSWWPIAVLLVIVLYTRTLYLYFTRTHGYWKKRGVPYVKPLPVIGNLKDMVLFKKTFGEVYEDLYWKLDGHKYGGIFKFGQPTLLLRDPEVIKTILVKDFNSFHDNYIEIDTDVDPLFGRNPFVLRGESWKTTRSQLTPAFTTGKLKPYFPLITEVCEELNELIEKSGPEFETKELCARYTTDVVATCAFGIRGNALQDPNCEFRQIGRELLEPDFWKNIKILMLFFLPKIAKMLKFGFGTQRVEKLFLRIIKEVISHREEHNITRPDYLHHLLTLKKKGSLVDDNEVTNGYDQEEFSPEKEKFTDEDVAAQASTFFTAGFETSSAVLAFTLYCLAVNPDVQEKARNEVETVIKKHGGQLTFDGIQEMSYLDMALSESMRMYPPGTVLFKLCTKPFKLETPSGGIYEVEVETPVTIPVYALHHDPQFYPDPKRYDPERFNEENKKIRHKFAYLPFGEGPRVCLGMSFALMQVKAGIASVIQHFEVRPNKNTPIPIVPDPTYFLLSAKGGLWLDFVKRTDK